VSPLHRRSSVRPLPLTREPASARCCQRAGRVPSAWFRTTSTGFSERCLRACCIPLPIMGFAAFQHLLDRFGPKTGRPEERIPAARFIPPEGFPSPVAVPRHRGRCLPDLPALAALVPRTAPGTAEAVRRALSAATPEGA
jgi:hypothetical protein